jgi:4a-hydroxytetrahydrobiopterin dehydratase
MGAGDSRAWRQSQLSGIYLFIVIPAQAGIQEDEGVELFSGTSFLRRINADKLSHALENPCNESQSNAGDRPGWGRRPGNCPRGRVKGTGTRKYHSGEEENMTTLLAKKKCVPCEKGTPPLKGKKLTKLYNQLSNGWLVLDDHHLEKNFKFKNFRQALDFTNQVGKLADTEGHHPDIYLAWGKVHLKVWTHKIDGLSENDFIFAAKVDHLPAPHTE